jgi:hypothetical protein
MQRVSGRPNIGVRFRSVNLVVRSLYVVLFLQPEEEKSEAYEISHKLWGHAPSVTDPRSTVSQVHVKTTEKSGVDRDPWRCRQQCDFELFRGAFHIEKEFDGVLGANG